MSNPRLTPAALAAAAKGDVANALTAMTPGGIERQEAEGQQVLTSTFNRLPKEYGARGEFPRELMERLGFKIGAAADGLWQPVTPPEGWTLRPGDSSYWSYIHDAAGNRRGSVFYKAAFYDQRAHFSLDPRYTVTSDYRDSPDKQWENGFRRVVIKDAVGDVNLVEGEWIGNTVRGHDQDDAFAKQLAERFPDHRNVEAYWP